MATASPTPIAPAEKLKRIGRLRALAEGSVRIQFGCPHCASTNLDRQGGDVVCCACGHSTTEKALQRLRRRRIERYVRTGDR